jgi:uncharacterized Zn ribbon protein
MKMLMMSVGDMGMNMTRDGDRGMGTRDIKVKGMDMEQAAVVDRGTEDKCVDLDRRVRNLECTVVYEWTSAYLYNTIYLYLESDHGALSCEILCVRN